MKINQYICIPFGCYGCIEKQILSVELAAREFREKMIYVSVPHSAYYSCLMFMRHIWIEKLGNTEESFAAMASQTRGKTGSHELLINQISTTLVKSGAGIL